METATGITAILTAVYGLRRKREHWVEVAYFLAWLAVGIVLLILSAH